MKKKYELIDYFMIFNYILYVNRNNECIWSNKYRSTIWCAVNVDKHMVGLSINQKWIRQIYLRVLVI